MHPPRTSPPRPGASVAQLKDDIDSGLTGDKLAGLDPGAAPLGTDEEAAGTRPDPRLIEIARTQERAGRPANAAPNGSTPELQPDARLPRQSYALPALMGLAAGAAVGLVLLAAL